MEEVGVSAINQVSRILVHSAFLLPHLPQQNKHTSLDPEASVLITVVVVVVPVATVVAVVVVACCRKMSCIYTSQAVPQVVVK